jgi:predicted small secreted protein
MKKSDWAVAVGLALCAATLAACGSNASGSGEDAAAQEEGRLEFAECMREHGVEMADPTPGQKGVIIGGPAGKQTSGGAFNPDNPATKKALAACKGKLGDLGQEPSPQEQEEFKEDALAFAECMREHGVDMPDPQFDSEGHVQIRIGGPGGHRPSPESPAFQKAQETCQSKLPNGKGGPIMAAPAR